MSIPNSVLAAGWIPFAVSLLLILVFSIVYIRVYQHRRDKELFSTIASILGLAVALLTSAIVPVDIFLVSFMKNSDGTYKEWAESNETRNAITDDVLYAYYALYCCVSLFVFIILPMAYFFYEEGGEDHSVASRCCTALKYSAVFILAAVVLFLIGAFVNFRQGPDGGKNSTEWERIKNLFEDLHGAERWEDSVSFTISALTLLGMLALVLYTGYGMSAWPMDLVAGKRSVTSELSETVEKREALEAEIQAIRNSYRARGERAVSRSERRQIERLEDEIELCVRRERHLQAAQRSWYRKCSKAFRPIEIVFGCIFYCIAMLVFISLLLTNIDKLMHSLGWKSGYILTSRSLPNPIDITLLYAQKVFTLDYILMAGIVLYFFYCSVSGLKAIGVWMCCIKMYNIRWRRTCPQGLLMMCFLLMFMVLAINILIYEIAPQYSMYGSQHYINKDKKVVSCSTKAPASECTLSRMSMLVTRFCYKFWFFGAAYYWISWALLLVFLVGFVVSLVRKRRSYIENIVEQEDLHDSDEELLRP